MALSSGWQSLQNILEGEKPLYSSARSLRDVYVYLYIRWCHSCLKPACLAVFTAQELPNTEDQGCPASSVLFSNMLLDSAKQGVPSHCSLPLLPLLLILVL